MADPNLSLFFTCFLGFLALFCFLCMIPLRLSEESLRKDKQRLENQIVSQQHDLLVARDAAAASRLEMQRQFDAFRATSSGQLIELETRTTSLQAQLEEAHKQSWKRQAELQSSLDRALSLCEGTATAIETPVPPVEPQTVAAPAASALPVFPELEAAAAPKVDLGKVAELKSALSLAQYKTRRLASMAKATSKSPRTPRVSSAAVKQSTAA